MPLITTVRSVEVAFSGAENFTVGVARKSPVTETDLEVAPDGVLTHFALAADVLVDVGRRGTRAAGREGEDGADGDDQGEGFAHGITFGRREGQGPSLNHRALPKLTVVSTAPVHPPVRPPVTSRKHGRPTMERMTRDFSVPQARKLVTDLPGPRSIALQERRVASVSRGAGTLANIYMESGSGAILVDVDGNRLIDLGCGIGVTTIGHAHPAVAAAAAEQAGEADPHALHRHPLRELRARRREARTRSRPATSRSTRSS